MPLNEQQTSGPYSADVLNVHDKDLVWVREFGTEVTGDTGQAFTTNFGGAGPDITSEINARLGMLSVSTRGAGVNAFEAPRGTTFELPDWDSFPDSPAIAVGFKAVVLYAHLLNKTRGDGSSNSASSFVDLVLGSENLEGDNLVAPLVCCGIDGNIPINGEPSAVQVDVFNNGGNAGPTESDDVETWGNDVYWRIFMSSQAPTFKTTNLEIAVSQKGLAWQQVASVSMDDLVVRVGAGVRCAADGLLDWARLYTWVITDASGQFIEPPMPETGGRLFTP